MWHWQMKISALFKVQSVNNDHWSKLFTALTVSYSCQRFVSTIAIMPGCVRWFKCWGWVGSLVEILNLKISSQSVRCITLWRRVLKRFFFFQFWNSSSIPSQVGLLPQIVFLPTYAMLWVSLDSKRRFRCLLIWKLSVLVRRASRNCFCQCK